MKTSAWIITAVFCIIVNISDCVARQRDSEVPSRGDIVPKGLFPDLINLATNARISVNATCGFNGPETYCKLTEHAGNREPQCGVCDGQSTDSSRRHPIENVIDGTSSWWQSPTLAEGSEYEWVAVTLDLKHIYQVAYVIVKSAISPRPGTWILERSLDGVMYEPWQYYVTDDEDCISNFGFQATPGQPHYSSDTEVICTSYFSKLNPLEGGEIHTSLVIGRPGADDLTEELQGFTETRYVRLNLRGIRTLHAGLQGSTGSRTDQSVTKRYFYSIKDISIGGRCVCHGHADSCDLLGDGQKCSCVHNTCGSQCNTCCPMYNQKPWRAGNFTNGGVCEQCQCHGHSDTCVYNNKVATDSLSVNGRGHYDGGGVCVTCKHNTDGVNCEKCKPLYYRPQGMSPDDRRPCRPCECVGPGTDGDCVYDDTQVNLGLFPGACICRRGFKGPRCDTCHEGFRNYPECDPCPCDSSGSTNGACEGECICKDHVTGPRCDLCLLGTFHLDEENIAGCTPCFCNGATDSCEAASLPVYTVTQRQRWQVTNLRHQRTVEVVEINEREMRIAHEEMSTYSAYFWLAPDDYVGFRTTSYGQSLHIHVSWVKLRGDTSGRPTRCPDVIIEGAGYKIAYGIKTYRGKNSAKIEIPLYEHGWFHFPKELADIEPRMDPKLYTLAAVTRYQMMQVLASMKVIMIRARFHSVQVEGILLDVALEYGREGGGTATLVTGAVERCHCPTGYTGLSCEGCELGYRRVNTTIYGGVCELCDCNRHVNKCDPYTGTCGECLHNTAGGHCEHCAIGYYGDALQATPDACQPCSCPRPIGENHFVPHCVPDIDLGGYKCLCPVGYDGPRCEMCADGFYGNPQVDGSNCKPCECSNNVDPRSRGNCDQLTGQCLRCLGNTAGWHCERCKENHYGSPERGQCLNCDCHGIGSESMHCDEVNGQCKCKHLYTGQQCDRCEAGHGGVTENCPPCRCDPRGATTDICHPVSGECPCKPGVGGRTCDHCLKDHFGDLASGCNMSANFGFTVDDQRQRYFRQGRIQL